MSRVFVAGHRGMVGAAIVNLLSDQADVELVLKTHEELDLTNQRMVQAFFADNEIEQVYIAAAKVGGIHANSTYPADFIYQNLMIQSNVIHSAYEAGVNKLLFLGSSCIYPRHAEQPMDESQLLTGALEPTNEAYAVAKIAGIKQCEAYNRQYGVDYRSVMPTNLYGQNDNFHPSNSHVIPAMMRRFHEAKINSDPEMVIWGTGKPKREFLHVDDMASASVHIMGLKQAAYEQVTSPHRSHINVGTGEDCSIAELAEAIGDVVGFTGELVFDSSKPDGSPRKLLNIDRLNSLGWHATIGLKEGLVSTYDWFVKNQASLRGVA